MKVWERKESEGEVKIREGKRDANKFKYARSSNGRTAVSGTAYRGSSPCRAALSINHP